MWRILFKSYTQTSKTIFSYRKRLVRITVKDIPVRIIGEHTLIKLIAISLSYLLLLVILIGFSLKGIIFLKCLLMGVLMVFIVLVIVCMVISFLGIANQFVK
jgi:hypothetical protein